MIKNSERRKARQWKWSEGHLGDKQRDIAIAEGATDVKRFVYEVGYDVVVCWFPDGTARITIIDPSCKHRWSDYQGIKNDLLGENWEGLELYPSTDRLVDTANQFHLWCKPGKLHVGWFGEATVTAACLNNTAA